MDRCKTFLLFNLFLVTYVQADTRCNLKEIFKTPQRRNYDQLEIVERSNFLSDEPVQIENCRGDYGAPNARVFLRLGDYNNAIRRNNNNVNTRITLAGPNHNNYYTPLIQPYYTQVQYPWNLIYPVPKIPRSNYILPSSYFPQYQVVPQAFPEQPFDDPIVYDRSAIQRIALPSPRQQEILPANGLNTMTVIPKIIIDNVVKKPLISNGYELEIEQNRNPLEIDASLPCPCGNPVKPVCKKQLPKVEAISPCALENIRNPEPVSICDQEVENKSVSCEDKERVPLEGNGIVIEEPVVLSDCKSKNTIILSDTQPEEAPVDVLTSEVPREIQNIDHPRVLHPVKLSNDIENVEILGAGNVNISLTNNCPQKVEKYANAKDLALEKLLQKSLVPFINLRTNEKPKFLVSYPVVRNCNENFPDHPSAIIVRTLRPVQRYCSQCAVCGNRQRKIDIDNLNVYKGIPIIPQVVEVTPSTSCKCSNDYQVSSSQAIEGCDGVTESVVSGYKVSSGSGCYEDPLKKIVYNKPTEVTVVTPQVTKCNKNLVYSQRPLCLQEPITQEVLVNPTPGCNLQSASESKTKSINLLKHLVSDILSPKKCLICPYCSKEIKIVPALVNYPYSLGNRQFVGSDYRPINAKTSCPYSPVSGNNIEEVLIPKPSENRCPYCANYRGELNQLA